LQGNCFQLIDGRLTFDILVSYVRCGACHKCITGFSASLFFTLRGSSMNCFFMIISNIITCNGHLYSAVSMIGLIMLPQMSTIYVNH